MNPPPPNSVDVKTYQDATRSLVDRRYLRSQEHKDQVRFTDLSFANPRLVTWVGKLLRRAAKMGIPLECLSASYDVAFIVHGRRQRELTYREWEVVAHLGEELSAQYHLRVHWGGPRMASCWMAEGANAPPF